MADRVVPMARLLHTISVFLSVSRFTCKTYIIKGLSLIHI